MKKRNLLNNFIKNHFRHYVTQRGYQNSLNPVSLQMKDLVLEMDLEKGLVKGLEMGLEKDLERGLAQGKERPKRRLKICQTL